MLKSHSAISVQSTKVHYALAYKACIMFNGGYTEWFHLTTPLKTLCIVSLAQLQYMQIQHKVYYKL